MKFIVRKHCKEIKILNDIINENVSFTYTSVQYSIVLHNSI